MIPRDRIKTWLLCFSLHGFAASDVCAAESPKRRFLRAAGRSARPRTGRECGFHRDDRIDESRRCVVPRGALRRLGDGHPGGGGPHAAGLRHGDAGVQCHSRSGGAGLPGRLGHSGNDAGRAVASVCRARPTAAAGWLARCALHRCCLTGAGETTSCAGASGGRRRQSDGALVAVVPHAGRRGVSDLDEARPRSRGDPWRCSRR